MRAPRTRDTGTGVTVDELAARIDEAGLGAKTLGAIERGERAVRPKSELRVIAEALELPLAFFTLEREDLLEALEGPGAPGVPGETGRRLRDRRPTGEDRQRSSNDEEEGQTHAERE